MPKDESLAQQGNLQRRLTKNESTLRNNAAEREQRQRYITSHWWQYTDNGIVEQLRQAHTRLMAWGNRNKNKPSCTEPQPTVSPWAPTPGQSEWVNIDWMVNADTLLQPITPPPLSRITDKPMTPRQLNSFPNTGENINVSEITQEQPSNQTIAYQHEMTPTQKKIIMRGQEEIRQVYQSRFLAKHPGKTYFPDRECMPSVIKMGILNHFSIASLLHEGNFPDTEVLVQLDPSLGDQIICE